MVLDVCHDIRSRKSVSDVVLTGGVWQNMVLLSNTVLALRQSGFTVYVHQDVPTNDGGIALGQAVVALHLLD